MTRKPTLVPPALLDGTYYKTEARLRTTWEMILAHHLVRAVESMFQERTCGGHSLSCSAPLLASRHHGAWHH